MEETGLPACLLISNGSDTENETFLSFYSPSENRLNTVTVPELDNKYILGSGYGWLVMVDRSTDSCSLWNPSSGEIIDLPELEDSDNYHKCVLSKPPTHPDCYILCTCDFSALVACCRVGGDEFVVKHFRIFGVVSFRGEIYCYAEDFSKFRCLTVNFTSDNTLKFRRIFIWNCDPRDLLRICVGGERKYFIKSDCGLELFLVIERKVCFYIHESGMDYRIFRVDVDRKECVELENIGGDRALFITHGSIPDMIGGYGNGVCYSSKSNKLIKGNSIYYTLANSKNLYRCDLETKTHTDVLPFTAASDSKCRSFWVDYQLFEEYIS